MGFIGKLFGVENSVKDAQNVINQINSLEPEFEKLSGDQLQEKTNTWKKELFDLSRPDGHPPQAWGGVGGEVESYLNEILPGAFAAVREAAKRTLGQRHYDVQLVAGLMLHQGKVAEMKTGEGKTLAATLAVYLNALTGRGVHLVTVNDYLARRDASWMGQVYHYLGLSVSSIEHQKAYLYSEKDEKGTEITEEESEGVQIDVKNLAPCSRKEAYAADILYGTNNEFGFDYLRDNMARSLDQIVQRDLNYAIIDEVDSILIDEARTPLIISAPDVEGTEFYREFAQLAKTLKPEDYILDEKHRQVTFSEEGYEKLEKKYGQEIYSDIRLRHHADSALRAQTLFKLDRDYVARDGEVVIVDEFTGRLMEGRRYSEGLHQAIEAKEGVEVKHESKTLATITFQNYFRLYKKLSGMTGTAKTEAEEFHKIYNLDVVEIPTNKAMIRDDRADSVYKNEQGKMKAIVKEIGVRHEKGQPVLVGTISIEKNEHLSKLLHKAGIKHELLNAKNHEREAQIIAQAGRFGAVTMATNIAGRGVDIILGGNPPDPESASRVKELGGLFVLGTERHESRRIDNQLRGRSGRQGDSGESQFFLSLEDDLMRLFGGERLQRMMDTLRVPDDQPIENRMVSRSIESAQKKIEGMNFDIRKHVLEFDDVLNKQRETIYRRRRQILKENVDLRSGILEKIADEIKFIIWEHTREQRPAEWDHKKIYEKLNLIFAIPEAEKKQFSDPELWISHLTSLAEKVYEAKEQQLTSEIMRQIERALTLQGIDNLWMEHLDTMDHLRQSVRLRGYAQRDPLVEYKKDGLHLFEQMLGEIDRTIVYTIYKVDVRPQTSTMPQGQERRPRQYSNISSSAPQGQPIQSEQRTPEGEKIGRNDPCPCGAVNPTTGEVYKWKKCGMINAPHHKG